MINGTLKGFSGVAFLFFRNSFSTTFLKDCGKGEGLRTTTCTKTVVGVSKGILPVKRFCFNKAFFVSVQFHGDHRKFMWDREIHGESNVWSTAQR